MKILYEPYISHYAFYYHADDKAFCSLLYFWLFSSDSISGFSAPSWLSYLLFHGEPIQMPGI